MALRNRPYLPLYVQDFMTDEKLMLCSASSTGVYIRLMCLMHKSEQYGTIILDQRFKKGRDVVGEFACQLERFMPYAREEIKASLEELIDADVLRLAGDTLYQKRMVKDAEISEKRSAAGRAGGRKSHGGSREAKPEDPAEETHKITGASAAKNENARIVSERWNTLQDVGIKPVFKISPHTKRYDMLAARIAQYGLENVLKAIDGIKESSFLAGKNSKGWQITFDWFVLPNNFPKVLEGNYIDKRSKEPLDEDSSPYEEWEKERGDIYGNHERRASP